ncbi:MAG: YggT family protein [Candidatus Cloacimonadota bacterium]|nr:YggT family protein [Candidatus Cloacimonadota bacterium]
MDSLRLLIAQAVKIYMYLVIFRVVLSWIRINPTGQFFSIYLFVIQITEPVMRPIREFLHKIFPSSPIDFSPIIVIVALDLIRQFLIGI